MAEIILEPTAQSKVIPLSIRLNDTDTSLVSQLVTNRQFSTADTDAWFSFTLEGLAATTGTFDLTLINLQDKSVFNHTDKVFSTNPFYYKLDSGTDELTNEIRHAGKWVGQLVVTLANGDSATRKFIFGIEGHILDGTVVQTILLEDYNALIADIESAKDELTQYNIDYASLIGTVTEQEAARSDAEELRVIADALRETKEGVRQATFEANEVIRDGVVDSAIEGEMIAQTVATKLTEKEATYAPRLVSVEQQLAEITPQVTLVDLKAKTYNVGDKIDSAVYGGSTWIVRNVADLKFQWSYQLDYDDELHVIVNLKGGGTAIAECQIASIIDYAKSLNKKAMTKYYLNLNEYKAVKLGFYGDSLTYGQYNGDGAVVAIGTPVNQDYPRLHEFNHLQKPIPTIVKETLLSVYHNGGEFISIDNRARSGDTITDCYRGCRVNKNYDVALFEFGVNDAALCIGGGMAHANITDSANINNVFVTTDVYKKLLVREMLRGSGVIIMTPHRYYNISSSTATRKFADSFKKMAKELDVLCLDWNEFIGDYEIHKITHDNIHLNAFGAEAIGKRIAGVLIGRGYDIADTICGERHMTVSKLKDNVITASSSFETWNSFSPSFYSAGQSDDIILGNTSPLFYPFYLEEDKKLVMPIGRVQTATGSITYEIDFGLTQPEFKLDIEVADRFADNGLGGLTNLNKAPSASKTIVNSAEGLEFSSKYINRPQDIDTHLCIQGRGWHVLTIKNNTADVVIINGVRFFNDAAVAIAKVDAY